VTYVPRHEGPITWDICREPRHHQPLRIRPLALPGELGPARSSRVHLVRRARDERHEFALARGLRLVQRELGESEARALAAPRVRTSSA
jgi:hypothetical protein